MSGWSARRFWKDATVVPAEGGFTVHLDARPLRTPLKAPLILPTRALAEAVAAEWQAQEGKVDPETMPFTRTANSAIDKVAPQMDAVAAMLAEYGGSDLLCYRAGDPPDLVARQAEAWDPILVWAYETFGADLVVTTGVIHVAQPSESLVSLHRKLGEMSAFQLSAFHDLVALSGSLVLALAVTEGQLGAEAGWSLSRIDEEWQISLWGEDEEAAEVAARKRAAFLQADQFYGLCG